MSGNHPVGIFTILGTVIGGVREYAAQSRNDELERKLRALQEKQARADERASLERQRRWLEFAEAQKSRGKAGNATPEQAHDALSGRGGRRSDLDDKWFC